MNLVLTPRLQTADQISEMVIELREYLGKLHDMAIRGRVANIHNEELPALSPLLQDLIRANGIAMTAVQPLRQLLTRLEELRITAPHMRVMLPAWPSASIRERITSQVRASLHPNMTLVFTVRADMGGGCVLQSGSHRYDFSFHTVLLANKHKISELLRKYATA